MTMSESDIVKTKRTKILNYILFIEDEEFDGKKYKNQNSNQISPWSSRLIPDQTNGIR